VKKIDDNARTRMRELGRLRSRADRFLSTHSGSPLADILRDVLAMADTLMHDLADAGEQCAAAEARVTAAGDDWNYLLERIPVACVCTDAHGVIVKANSAAGVLLNTSASRLDERLLMHFVDEREEFASILRTVVWDRAQSQASFTIRPRERAAVRVEALAVTRAPGDSNTVLWFLTPQSLTLMPALPSRRSRRAEG
jgi:PAS domain-containing protein